MTVANAFEDLFKELRNEQIEAPPYIETQIMSRLKERQRSKLSTRIWKMASVGLMAVLMVVGGRLVYISGDASFKAEVEKLNAHWAGWVYELPNFKARHLLRKMDALVEAEAPKAEDVPVQGPLPAPPSN